MFTGYQVIVLAFQFIATLIAVWGVISKTQSAMKAEVKGSLDELKKAHEKNLDESRAQFASINESFKNIALQINTILEGDVRELQARVQRLESGQDEWTKTLRQRTHDLGNELQTMRLELELLKVGHPHKTKDVPA